MFLEIITPHKVFFKGEVDIVRVPGTKGSFAMLNNHEAIVSSLEPGVIKVGAIGKERYFQLSEKALVEQHSNKITIIATKIEEVGYSALI
ncbi:MAG: F0F1 ATP synthase subunit epsilon [Bacteroidales bacterium]|nr:F0F1 ATP synthase subunit epsilon [Tenuifilaceae bacterium]